MRADGDDLPYSPAAAQRNIVPAPAERLVEQDAGHSLGLCGFDQVKLGSQGILLCGEHLKIAGLACSEQQVGGFYRFGNGVALSTTKFDDLVCSFDGAQAGRDFDESL